jgi:alkylation response protein AidB-like acyl-CoA dehydrogenase
MNRTIFDEEHDLFREGFRQFIAKEITPLFPLWERDGIVPRTLFEQAGASGFLGTQVPEEFGGGGTDDFRFNAIITEELMYAGHAGVVLCFSTHNDVCLPYLLGLGTEEQKARWLPGICSGGSVTAIAMTEPDTGSDLASIRTSGVRDGDCFIVNGAKTFISNGINADLVITAVKTDPHQRHAGMTLMVLERGMEGFGRGRNLEKVGLHCQDTAELLFENVRVPVSNVLGGVGDGFSNLVHNLPQERLGIAIGGVAAAAAVLRLTIDYTKERTAFGSPVAGFQNSKFRLAEMATEVDVAQTFVDRCIDELRRGSLTGTDAAKAKWWCTELQKRTVDTCVQLHGGYGYMLEYPVARAYLDARITTIYGGTTEIMKEIIGRSLIG